MAELLVEFDEPLIAPDGMPCMARAWGREDDISRWIGRLEFVPRDGGASYWTDSETVQPNRRDLEYWVTGLTRVYLDGALARAWDNANRPHPAVARAERRATTSEAEPRLRPILDPFATYAQGENVLRAELGALSVERLRNIAAAFAISSPETCATRSAQELREQIIAAARHRLGRVRRGLSA